MELVILLVLFWLGCGYIAAGWNRADFLSSLGEQTDAWLYFMAGTVAMIVLVLIRIRDNTGKGWLSPRLFVKPKKRVSKIQWFGKPK